MTSLTLRSVQTLFKFMVGCHPWWRTKNTKLKLKAAFIKKRVKTSYGRTNNETPRYSLGVNNESLCTALLSILINICKTLLFFLLAAMYRRINTHWIDMMDKIHLGGHVNDRHYFWCDINIIWHLTTHLMMTYMTKQLPAKPTTNTTEYTATMMGMMGDMGSGSASQVPLGV